MGDRRAEGGDPRGLAERLGRALAQQREALLAGDWRALAACAERQEALLEALDLRSVGASPKTRESLRRLRRDADRNARLALRLREGLERRLRGACRQVTYDRRGKLGTGATALLNTRG